MKVKIRRIMRKPNDIFDLFRQQQHKLNERPSPHVWRRLEDRLGHRQQARHHSMLRQWSLAAAVVILTGLVWLITWSIDRPAPATPLASNHYGQPIALEDIEPGEGDALMLQKVSLTREEYRSGGIEEGGQDNRVVARSTAERLFNRTSGPDSTGGRPNG